MPDPVRALFQRAEHTRARVRACTDAYRLVDGAADGLPGVEVEVLGGCWVFQTRGTTPPAAWVAAALDSGARAVYWKRLERAERQPPSWLGGDRMDAPFEILENGLRFRMDLGAGYSQGLFLDQRDNRGAVRAHFAARGGGALLNGFAYTCGFGLAAAAAGADTVNIDLSRRTLDWGGANYAANGLGPASHGFLAGDVFEWLRRMARTGRRFDMVVMDPPTFSRDRRGRVFRVETGMPGLVAASVEVLAPGGVLVCSTNQRNLAPDRFEHLVREGLRRPARMRRLAMPPDFRGESYLKALWVEIEE